MIFTTERALWAIAGLLFLHIVAKPVGSYAVYFLTVPRDKETNAALIPYITWKHHR